MINASMALYIYIILFFASGGLHTHDMCDWKMELFDQTNLITSTIEILYQSRSLDF